MEKLLEQEMARISLSRVDRSLCQELVYGVVRWEMTLDWLIARKTSARPQGKPPPSKFCCAWGFTKSSGCNASPPTPPSMKRWSWARSLVAPGRAGFLNAVLRGYVRQHQTTLAQLKDLKQKRPRHRRYSHPAWLVERWLSRWGREKTAQLLEWDNSPPPTFARLNLLQKTAAAALIPPVAVRADIVFKPREWDWTGKRLGL